MNDAARRISDYNRGFDDAFAEVQEVVISRADTLRSFGDHAGAQLLARLYDEIRMRLQPEAADA